MKKYIKILTVCLIFLTVLFSTHSVYANEVKVVDESQILTSVQEQTLTEKINKVVSKYQFDLVILIVDSTQGKSINSYADDYFDEHGYGIGKNYDGALLVLDYKGREMGISTSGYGLTAFTDYGIDYIFDQLVEDMQAAHYYQAFEKYIQLSDKFLKEAKANMPYDTNHEVPKPIDYPLVIIIGLCGGLLVAFIATLKMKSQLKSVKPLGSVQEYVTPKGLTLTKNKDIFLYSSTTLSKVSESSSQSSSSSDHGGGSSSHISSSGRTHGGGSRKF